MTTPSLYRCPKCRNVVVVSLPAEVRCLRCAKLMRRVGTSPEPLQKPMKAYRNCWLPPMRLTPDSLSEFFALQRYRKGIEVSEAPRRSRPVHGHWRLWASSISRLAAMSKRLRPFAKSEQNVSLARRLAEIPVNKAFLRYCVRDATHNNCSWRRPRLMPLLPGYATSYAQPVRCPN
jgi:hypothetical protein